MKEKVGSVWSSKQWRKKFEVFEVRNNEGKSLKDMKLETYDAYRAGKTWNLKHIKFQPNEARNG